MRHSLSAPGGTSNPSHPTKPSAYEGLEHPPHAQKPCDVKPLSIRVEDGPDGEVPGFLHLPTSFIRPVPITDHHYSDVTAAILLSGARGGVVGPSSMYISIADKLASLQKTPIPCLRLDYRYPARNRYCVQDVTAAMDFLEREYALSRFVLVGWSFGGAPVFTIGGMDQRVVGCATVASQTAETVGIRRLSPRPVLLLHGTNDQTLDHFCSEDLYKMYGEKGDRTLELFEGDDHSLSKNSLEAERMIGEFILKCAGVERIGVDDKEALKEELV